MRYQYKPRKASCSAVTIKSESLTRLLDILDPEIEPMKVENLFSSVHEIGS